MAINGKHTTEVMIFPRVCCGASGCVREHECAHAWHANADDVVGVLSVGRGGEGVVSMYVRAYHPIRTLALGLLNATSVQLPCTLGYLSIYPFIGRRRIRRVAAAGGRMKKVDAGASERGCQVLTFSQHR